jgi:hypothetical protein
MDDVIEGFGSLMTDYRELPQLYHDKIKEQAAKA